MLTFHADMHAESDSREKLVKFKLSHRQQECLQNSALLSTKAVGISNNLSIRVMCCIWIWMDMEVQPGDIQDGPQ